MYDILTCSQDCFVKKRICVDDMIKIPCLEIPYCVLNMFYDVPNLCSPAAISDDKVQQRPQILHCTKHFHSDWFREQFALLIVMFVDHNRDITLCNCILSSLDDTVQMSVKQEMQSKHAHIQTYEQNSKPGTFYDHSILP